MAVLRWSWIGLKKFRPVSGAVRLEWIESACKISLVRQCELAGVSKATVYRPREVARPEVDDLTLCALIDEEFTRHPFYGSWRMVVMLKRQGWLVNHKLVQRLMRMLGLAGMAPGPGAAVQHPGHKVYPYLLRGLAIVRPNHVWSTDITYIRLARGFAFYNSERPHQALNYQTPDVVYETGEGGGAMIVDKYGSVPATEGAAGSRPR